MAAALLGILAAVGTFLLGLIHYYRNRSKAAEVANQQLEQATAAIERETKDRVGRLEDVDAYHRYRADGLSPAEALAKVEKEGQK